MEILIIVLFNIIVFWRTLKFSIIVDDIRHYSAIKTKKWDKPVDLKDFFAQGFAKIQFRLYGGATFGTDPKLDHAVTIFLHTCICVLIYMAFGYSQISFMAAMLYACNPANTQTSIWLNGRRYAINIILVLLMIVYSPWGLILYPFTFMNSQVAAIFSPILVKGIHPLWLLAIPLFYLPNRKQINRKISSRMEHILCDDQRKFKLTRLVVIVKSFGFYFFNMIAPIRVMMNYPNLYWWGITQKKTDICYSINWEFWKGVIAILLSIAGLVYFKDYMRIMWLFILLSTLQWSAILSAVQVNSDRYTSLPNMFMMFFIAYFINMLPYSMTIFMCLCVYYLCQLSIVMIMYQSIDEYQRYQMFFCPKITKPRFNRIEFYLKKSRFLTAWYLIEEGLQHIPDDFHLLVQASICAAQLGNLKQSQELLESASKNYYLGQESFQKGQLENFRKLITQPPPTRQQRRAHERKMRKEKK